MKYLDYSKDEVPEDYKCHDCGAQGCKLWRDSGFPPILLQCVDCAVRGQNNPQIAPAFHKSASQHNFYVEEDGMYTDHYGQRTDQIGWRMPAVPTEDNMAYWGYSSVPQAGV